MADDDLSDQPLPKPGQQVPAPAQQTMPAEMQAARQTVLQGIMNLTGARDAAAALRGELTPEQQQMFMATAALGLIPGARFAEPAAEVAAQTAAKGIRAFHGSPYDFAKFDLSKIGTGEGAQAYGHGLYFAERPEVARQYRESLSPNVPENVAPDTQAIAKFQKEWDALVPQRQAAAGPSGRGDTSAIDAQLDAVHKKMVDDTVTRNPNLAGRMYEVNINADPEHFLDWDKPVGEQYPEIVKKIMDTAYLERKAKENPDSWEASQLTYLRNRRVGDIAGDAQAVQKLREAGIPGIKYLDQGSRGDYKIFSKGGDQYGIMKPNGTEYPLSFNKADAQAEVNRQNKYAKTYNYVVFDDKLIDIIKKYGIAGLIGANASNWSPKKK
jgi:hypothetical protein